MAGRLRRSSMMERIREDLLRRAHVEERDDLEQGRAQQTTEPQDENRGWFTGLNPTRLSHLFQRRTEARNEEPVDDLGPDGPKTPVSNVTYWPTGHGNPYTPAARHPEDQQYQQASPRGGFGPSHTAHAEPEPLQAAILAPHSPPIQPHGSEESHINDYAEEHSEETTERRRRRRRQRSHKKRKHKQQRNSQPMLCCFSLPRSAKIRSYILRCFVSGTFLICLLIIYLALAVSKTIDFDQFTVVLVLVVVLATGFFSYSMIRLCILKIRKDRIRSQRRQEIRDPMPECYAVPAKPIRVVLARDEEAAGLTSESSKVTPPAYGIWRESVRVDPDRLFWQRSDASSSVYDSESSVRPQTSASRRPPSYISDDGVSYVVDAAPRSVVLPQNTYSIPPHPAEIRSIAV